MGSAYNRVIETRKELTKQLLAEMEQGELPWMKGWKTTGTRPYNPVTKAVYKGNNRLRLMLASHFGQFQDNRWVTFNQAKDKGWKIKSGEKGTLCEKWIFEEKKVIEDPVTGEKETVYEELEHPKVNYNVSAQKTLSVRKNVRGMNAPIVYKPDIIPTDFFSGILNLFWPDVLPSAEIQCTALLFQEKRFQ